jgi:hypothetical protein
LGIKDATFDFVEKYYGYLCGAPLSLTVDDTKLFSALRPLYNGGKAEVVHRGRNRRAHRDVDALHAALDRLAKTFPTMATKVVCRLNNPAILSDHSMASPLDPPKSTSASATSFPRNYADRVKS